MTKRQPKLLVIVGETASGKTELAIRLAQQFNGEIICADSATVRQGVDIGAAKPTAVEQILVPHHLIDVVGPNERFTAADFKHLAEKSVEDISNRGKLPIMVGGTGLYVDSVLYDYSFGVKDASDRASIRSNSLIFGLKVEREELKRRIAERLDAQIADGLEDEVHGLGEQFGWDCLALKNVGYAQWKGYFDGTQIPAETRRLIIKDTLDLAKRQRTWFKRNNSIQWLATPVNLTTVVDTVTTFLST